MDIKVTEAGPCTKVLEIEVPPERFESEVKSAYKKIRREVVIPGFRRGKAPMNLLRARFGERVQGDVLQKLIPEIYNEAREKIKLEPVSEANIEDLDFVEGKRLRFKATVEVKPKIDLEDYKGLRLVKRVQKITERRIGAALEDLRRQRATFVPVEGAAKEGDFLRVDLQILDPVSGMPIVGRKASDLLLELGNNNLGDQFNADLLGAVTNGEYRTMRIYPDDFEDAYLAGKQTVMLVRVKEVSSRQLPDLDDEFARDLNYHSLAELRSAVRQSLQQVPEEEVRVQALRTILQRSSFPVPQSMVEHYLDNLIKSMKNQSRRQIDEEQLRQKYRDQAVEQIRQYLVVAEIAKREGLEVTEEELDRHLIPIARQNRMALGELKRVFKESGRLERIRSEELESKVIDFLVEHADITEIKEK